MFAPYLSVVQILTPFFGGQAGTRCSNVHKLIKNQSPIIPPTN